jgi:two-component system, NtrC family, sensor kinase
LTFALKRRIAGLPGEGKLLRNSGRGGGHRGGLFRKYALVFVGLVVGSLLVSDGIQAYLSYQDRQQSVLANARDNAAAAALTIERFMAETTAQLAGVVLYSPASLSVDQRRDQYESFLRSAPSFTEIRYLDAPSRLQLRVTRFSPPHILSEFADTPLWEIADPAAEGKAYYGAVYFQEPCSHLSYDRSVNETSIPTAVLDCVSQLGEAQPNMTIAMHDRATGGLAVAVVNLSFIRDVISGIRQGPSGRAYVVDSRGIAIAYPGSKVTDISFLPQVRAAIESTDSKTPTGATTSQDIQGRTVLTAHHSIQGLGWSVFVEQPATEAFAPVYRSLALTAVLLLLALILALLLSVWFARRMAHPIRALNAAASRIGSGTLDQRIEIRTGDELQELAETFNRMAVQLRQSYGSLEHQVAERTRELGEAVTQLEAASRHKSDFLANMSHELRTPLNAIIGFSEVLLERMFGEINVKQKEYLHDILGSGRHLLSLINDILDISKVEAGRMELQPGSFDLRFVLQNAVSLVRERATRQGITLSLEIAPGIGEIEADERRVKQILFNLLSNALKFTPAGGRVMLTATSSDGPIEISVRDSGIGIRPEDQDRIFEEFQQAGPGKAIEGTGLGLALAKRFVEMHGGRIWVESTVGAGSSFTFTLPLRQPSENGEARDPDDSVLPTAQVRS